MKPPLSSLLLVKEMLKSPHMSEIPKSYEPKLAEEKWRQFWEEKALFKADASSKKPPYAIVLPPPNVTGVLHMGHALVDTIQDILIRFKRMCGFEVLWVPGTDHAGIATQTVVERALIRQEGKRRVDYKREEFLKHVWDWKEKSETHIIEQIKRLGCSLDFTRYRFTMDEEASSAVKEAFKRLFDEGLIYRGDYLVNWDPVTETALADDEVEYEEKSGSLWYIRYPLDGGTSHITIATTRPETMLGDVAVAVNPKDERYKDYIGKFLHLPLSDRLIPVIGDSYVDPDFGTGAVKITPAHDPNDHAIGFRHELPLINILTPTAHINENGGSFEGLSVEEAREAVVAALKKEGLIEKIEPHTHRVGVSYRSKAVIQPYLSKQWFIKMAPFKKKLREIVETKRVTLVPSNWEATYFHWIDNLRDWCISRQLWWGHRIPIWYHKEDPERIICYAGDDLPDEVKKEPTMWVQDEDVLDTWFSSSLWPFSTLGWPHKTPDLEKFYPNAVLVTGHDILFFWVARMILMGEHMMEEVPFKESFIHGLIYGKSYWRDNPEGGITYVSQEERIAYDLGEKVPSDVHSRWEKMSKSKGNVIDPLEIINAYGADAMRMALTSSVTHARQIDLDRRRFEEYKNFANKVWNGARFVLMNLEDLTPKTEIDETLFTLEDRWIITRLSRAIEKMNDHLNSYHFDQAATTAYSFFWDEFCAYYVEITKPTLFGKANSPEVRENKQKILLALLTHALLLLHPMTPFITEEIFQTLKERFQGKLPLSDSLLGFTLKALSEPSISLSPYPTKGYLNESEEEFNFLKEIVYALRNIKAEMGLTPQQAVDIYISGDRGSFIEENSQIISSLIRTKSFHYSKENPALPFASSSMVQGHKIVIPLPEELIEKERSRLIKEEEKLRAQIESLEKQLNNPSFVERAPPPLVEKTRTQLKDANEHLELLKEKLKLMN